MSLTFYTGDCRLSISQVADSRLLIALAGRDLGQLGRRPFDALEDRIGGGTALELYFDLRSATGATLEATSSWALWLRKQRARLAHVHMLTARPVITLSAKSIQRFAGLGDAGQIYVSRPR